MLAFGWLTYLGLNARESPAGRCSRVGWSGARLGSGSTAAPAAPGRSLRLRWAESAVFGSAVLLVAGGTPFPCSTLPLGQPLERHHGIRVMGHLLARPLLQRLRVPRAGQPEYHHLVRTPRGRSRLPHGCYLVVIGTAAISDGPRRPGRIAATHGTGTLAQSRWHLSARSLGSPAGLGDRRPVWFCSPPPWDRRCRRR